jgi:hypothetical protein
MPEVPVHQRRDACPTAHRAAPIDDPSLFLFSNLNVALIHVRLVSSLRSMGQAGSQEAVGEAVEHHEDEEHHDHESEEHHDHEGEEHHDREEEEHHDHEEEHYDHEEEGEDEEFEEYGEDEEEFDEEDDEEL